MNKESKNINSQEEISAKDVVDFFWRLRYWIAASVVVAGLLGFFYVKMQPKVYERQSWIMLNKNDGSNADLALLADMTGRTVQKKIDNEVFILRSPSIMQKVVEEYGMNRRYWQWVSPIGKNIGLKLKKTEFYKNSPFLATMELDSLAAGTDVSYPSVYVEFRNRKATTFVIKEIKVAGKPFEPEKSEYRYGEPVHIGSLTLYFTVTDPETMLKTSSRFAYSYSPSFSCAQSFIKNLDAETVRKKGSNTGTGSNSTDVVTMTYRDVSPARAEDILNAVVRVSNMESLNYANIASVNSIRFIDSRLADLAAELGDAERTYQQYQSHNVVLDLQSQSQMAMNTDMTYQKQLVDVRLQLSVLDMITKYLNETPPGEYRVIPTNIGISDVGLNSIISKYNDLVASRNRMVANSSENNPRVLNMNSQLSDGRKSIEISINNLVNVNKIREHDLEKTLDEGKSKMASIPKQQFEVQQFSRKINIIEPLYLMLQEKREESQIAMYSQADNFRVIEGAFGSSTPVSPSGKKILLLFMLIGFCIPPGIVWLRMQLKSKVETKSDVTDCISAPVVAVLPKAPKDFDGLISRSGRDILSESFRMLRSSLQYMPGCKVIQVTSSVPHEGKSFVSSNLAMSIANVGKRVLLIGMDIRKPALRQHFPKAVQTNNHNTVVGYLIGKSTGLDDLPTNSVVNPNLDVIFAGPVPPNPSELLTCGGQREIIEHFRDKYELNSIC